MGAEVGRGPARSTAHYIQILTYSSHSTHQWVRLGPGHVAQAGMWQVLCQVTTMASQKEQVSAKPT